MSNYAKRLAGLKKQWSEDKPHTGGGQLPEGKYQFIIKRALIEESKADFNKGNMTIVIHLEVVTGENKGRKHIYRLDLEAKANAEKGWPSGISRFKGLLDILHIEIPGSFDDAAMNEILKAMLNLVVAGQCVHNQKGYANVYINSLIDAPVDSEDDEEEAEEEDSDEDEDSEDEESDDEEDDDEWEALPPFLRRKK